MNKMLTTVITESELENCVSQIPEKIIQEKFLNVISGGENPSSISNNFQGM